MTIGDLERRAGIEQTPEARAAFWKPFAHLSAPDMIADGCAVLRALIALREMQTCPDNQGLTGEELAAIRAFAARHGRCWKAELNRQWMNASASTDLHRLRNRLGPSWLANFRLPPITD